MTAVLGLIAMLGIGLCMGAVEIAALSKCYAGVIPWPSVAFFGAGGFGVLLLAISGIPA